MTDETPDRAALEADMIRIATQIDEWWKQQMAKEAKLKKSDLFKLYPDLGSDSKFGKFIKGDLRDTGTTLEDWHSDYRAVWNQIEDFGFLLSATATNKLLPDLDGVKAVRKAFTGMIEEGSTRRVLLVKGVSGTGKTCIAAYMRERWGSRVAVVECMEVWQGKPNQMLQDICRALGMDMAGLPVGAADKTRMLVAALRRTRTCIAFEESQNLTKELIETLKSLINQTPGEFVFLFIPILMRRLCRDRDVYEQALQVFDSHRLFGTIVLEFSEGDAARMLRWEFGNFPDIAWCARQIAKPDYAPKHGNLGFVRDVIGELKTILVAHDKTDAARFAEAMELVIERRTGIKRAVRKAAASPAISHEA